MAGEGYGRPMPLRTPLCDLLGVRHPIGNAGMAGVAGPALCGAVAEAGGIASLALSLAAPDDVAGLVADVRARSSLPFSVNLITWILDGREELLDAALGEGVASITLSFGDPTPYVGRVHDGGALAICQVQTLEAARRALAAGADVLIAQGSEAGGHTGEIPLLPFLPQVVDAAGDVPVIAAGGIGDGRGLAAVLMLGAQGALMGTRFLAAPEAASEVWPHLGGDVVDASADDTVWSTAFDIEQGRGRSPWPTGLGERSIRTPFLDEWAGREEQLAAALRESDADVGDATPSYAGPIAGMVTEREAVGDIIEGVVGEATEALRSGVERFTS